ncbi:MAG: hypothetical protein WC824_10910 [Bacteroidota bacterium]|jgi:hypothetical protein
MQEEITREDKRLILQAIVSDLVSNFLYYDRKGSGEWPRVGELEDAVREGAFSEEELVGYFREALHKRFPEK